MHRTDARRRPRGGDDSGFTLVEVLVAVAIIAVVMLGLGAVFVATAAGTDASGLRQTAARVATGGLDRAHALTGGGVLKGRDQSSTDAQWSARPAGVTTLLGPLTAAFDPTATAGQGTVDCATAAAGTPCAALPVSTTSKVDGITFTQSFYVAGCALDTTGTCRPTATSGIVAVPMLEVVVGVSWRDKACAKSTCTYQISTLLAANTTEPLFNSNVKATGPTVSAIADKVLDVTEGVGAGAPVTFQGGNGAVTLTASGLPDGITLDPTTGSFVGTATTPTPGTGGTKVTVTATDRFGLFGTSQFTWTVNPLPKIADAAVLLVSGSVQTVDLGSVLKLTGGTGPYAWSCTGLPVGATLDRTTGILTVPATALGVLTAVCTVTDARNQPSSATLTATLSAPLTITTPATNPAATTVTRLTTVSTTLKASGCSGTCTWSADKLPAGISLSAAGVLTGRPTTATGSTPVKTTFTVRDTAGRTTTTVLNWTVL